MTNATLSLSIGATRDAGPSCSARKEQSHERPVANPESVRNSQVRGDGMWKLPSDRVAKAIAQASNTTTLVRTAVAKFESTPATPSFAKIAVAAANSADNSAQKSHVMLYVKPCSIA